MLENPLLNFLNNKIPLPAIQTKARKNKYPNNGRPTANPDVEEPGATSNIDFPVSLADWLASSNPWVISEDILANQIKIIVLKATISKLTDLGNFEVKTTKHVGKIM